MAFTNEQQAAISAQNRELLVSAAAGSGKTAVLIERIYTMIHERGYSVDRMLVVTFTRAAAAEMRERLELRLEEAALTDRRMQRQSEMVETAQISTLHSLCQQLVREHFQLVDIDPQAALCDETLRANLFGMAIEQTLDEAFDQAKEDSELAALTQKFAENEIADMVSTMYPFLMALPNPFEWVRPQGNHLYSDKDLRESAMARTLLHDCDLLLQGALTVYQSIKPLAESPDCRDGYREAIRADGILLEELNQAASEGLGQLAEKVNELKFMALKGYRLSEPGEIEVRDTYKARRERIKKIVEDLRKLLPGDARACVEDLQRMQPALRGLIKVMEKVDENFKVCKADRSVIDFHDLEHMTLELLRNPEVCKRVAKRYDAIFVDEYQDISATQEAILNALKRKEAEEGEVEPCCFYVGDVKQSIYRFRQADPTLFMQKQAAFSSREESDSRIITLNKNFRSREMVLDGVNRVFSHVMRENVTEIEYNEAARLYPGIPSEFDPATVLHIIKEEKLPAAERPIAEATIIAEEMKRMVNQEKKDREGRPCGTWSYRDFAVLLPVSKGIAQTVERVLMAHGIPVYSEDGNSGMESPEITQGINHLRVMENPADDLALLSELRGPVYALTERELAAIRMCRPEKGAGFWEAVQKASKQIEDPKLAARCRAVLDDLETERFLMHAQALDEYLWGYLQRSGMYGFYGAQPGGKLRQANLRMLCSRAGEHMRSRGGDVGDFISSMTATGGVRDKQSPTVLNPWEDVVRIMTIHKSKGLEFPAVFVMGLGGNLHRPGKGGGILSLHSKLGVGLRYINEETRTKRQTLLQSAIAMRERAEEKAERARVLYVAMTRARDRLFLIGGSPQLGITPEDVGVPSEDVGESLAVWEAKSMLEWICQSLQKGDQITVRERSVFSTEDLWESKDKTVLSIKPTSFPQKKGAWEVFFHISDEKSSIAARQAKRISKTAMPDKALLEARMNLLLETAEKHVSEIRGEIGTAEFMEKPNGRQGETDPIAPSFTFTHAPLKQGVTAWCRAIRDNEKWIDGEDETSKQKRIPLPLTKPKLLSDMPQIPSFIQAPPQTQGLQRGVATHHALAVLRLDELRTCAIGEKQREMRETKMVDIIANEMKRLREQGILTLEEESLVDAMMLARFFAGETGMRMLRSEEVKREWSFNLLAPDLSVSILQGVIDTCFTEGDDWVLMDYKTDRVEQSRALWELYGEQMTVYKRALEEATGRTVKETLLFSLHMGEAAEKKGLLRQR